MSSLEQLDQHLMKEHHHNYWHEQPVDEARQLLAALSIDEWETLHHIWRQKPSYYQWQLASAVRANSSQEITLLEDMLFASNIDVVVEVAEELIDAVQWRPNEKVLQRVMEVSKKHLDDMQREAIDTLKQKVER